MPDIEIEIDGKKIKTETGKMIIHVADENDIYIPRFCYHKKLSIAANCRMCLVEVEKAPKTLPACATPVMEGMKVFTQSAKAIESQRAVMEFLLINHPLDCPVCDQGGQCELQDFSLNYGKDYGEYREEKRSIANDNFGPLIATEMTRCIQCTRCVRFGEEILGQKEIAVLNRGEREQIGTYVQHTLQHELSANIIDLCPVGALLSKPFLYTARSWELQAYASIAPHDGVGSNVFIHTRRGEVMRVTSRDNESINESWLSDNDRFSYQGLNVDRLEHPLIKDKASGEWREVTWQSALNYVADALEKIVSVHGGQALSTLLSANASLEEAYLLQSLSRFFGSSNIEYRLRKSNTGFALMPGMDISISEIENQDCIVLIGSHLRNDHPLLAHHVRKAALKGAKIYHFDSVRHPYFFDIEKEEIVKPSEWTHQLDSFFLSQFIKNETEALSSKKCLFILGEAALNHPHAQKIYDIVFAHAQKIKAHMAILPAGANARGCHEMGAFSFSNQTENTAAKAYILHGIEPEYDVINPKALTEDLISADFVLAVTPWVSDHLKQVATVLLPSAAFSETSGTFVNLSGQKQSFMGCVLPKGQARPAWKIYRVLANLLNIPDFDFESSEDVLRACYAFLENKARSDLESVSVNCSSHLCFSDQDQGLELNIFWPDCRSDSLLRRAKALNERALEKGFEAIHIHPKTAEKYNLACSAFVLIEKESNEIPVEIIFDESVAEDLAYLAAGTSLFYKIGSGFGRILLK